MSLIGKRIAPFTLDAFDKNTFTQISDTDLLGKWSVIVFYPGDFTFVCPTELEDLANFHDQFLEIGCEIYSASTDSHYVHKAWHDASKTINKIKYPMLADQTGRLAKSFGVLIEDTWEALRGSFVINPEGVIVAYEVNDLGIGRSADSLLKKVRAAQFVAENGNEACPANWEPGKETLKPGIDLVGKI